MKIKEGMKGKKTLIFALIVEVLGVLETFNWTELLGSEKAGGVLMIIGILIAFFRLITTTPITIFGISIGGGGVDTGENGNR